MKNLALCCAAAALAAIWGTQAHAAPTYHLAKKISLPGDTGWDYIYADPLDHRLYITRGSQVQVVDTASDTLVGAIADLSGIHGVAIDIKDGRGFISDGGSNSVTIFDLKTLNREGDIAVGQRPDCIVFDSATGRVFTFNGRSSDSTAIDAVTGKVLGTIALPGRPEFAVADTKGHIYNNIEDKNEIASIDTRSLKVDSTWSIAPGDGPSGIAMDRKNRRVYSVCGNQMLVVSDPDAGKVVTTAPIGNGPDACSFDPRNAEIFAPAGRDGTVTVIHEVSPDKYETVATVPTQAGARTITLDERTHKVYTVSATRQANPDPNATGHNRYRFVPGSFTVLVLEPGN